MRTNVYIDGFNLYYGAVKGAPYRWLDIDALSRCLLQPPRHQIHCVRYFTAAIAARPNDPQGPARQDAYLRALATLPTVSIHRGHFLTSYPRMRLAADPTQAVQVIKTEEKGSDVNLATLLLADAFRGDAECFVLVTNDSDLAGPGQARLPRAGQARRDRQPALRGQTVAGPPRHHTDLLQTAATNRPRQLPTAAAAHRRRRHHHQASHLVATHQKAEAPHKAGLRTQPPKRLGG